jgi:hypothetical protein
VAVFDDDGKVSFEELSAEVDTGADQEDDDVDVGDD